MQKKRIAIAFAAALLVWLVWFAGQAPTAAKTGDPLIDAFLLVEVASVADAVEQITGQRAHMSSDIQPLFPSKFAGPAVTVMLKKEEHKDGAAAFQGALDAIDAAPPGSVYVIVLEDGKDIAGIGGLMGTAMKVRGLAGSIIDGGVRDTPQLRKIQFPVFSRGAVPSTSVNHYRFVGSNIEVMCAGVKVRPDDIIVADEDGVAVVPRDRAGEILKKAEENDQTEHAMYPFIEKVQVDQEGGRRVRADLGSWPETGQRESNAIEPARSAPPGILKRKRAAVQEFDGSRRLLRLRREMGIAMDRTRLNLGAIRISGRGGHLGRFLAVRSAARV